MAEIGNYGAMVERWLAGEIEETLRKSCSSAKFVHHKSHII
jgi:hypothetical protein